MLLLCQIHFQLDSPLVNYPRTASYPLLFLQRESHDHCFPSFFLLLERCEGKLFIFSDSSKSGFIPLIPGLNGYAYVPLQNSAMVDILRKVMLEKRRLFPFPD